MCAAEIVRKLDGEYKILDRRTVRVSDSTKM